MNKKQNLNRKEKEQRIKELEMENQLLKQRLSFIVTIAQTQDWTQTNETIKDLGNKTVQRSVKEKLADSLSDEIMEQKKIQAFAFKKDGLDKDKNDNDKKD